VFCSDTKAPDITTENAQDTNESSILINSISLYNKITLIIHTKSKRILMSRIWMMLKERWTLHAPHPAHQCRLRASYIVASAHQ